MNEENVPVSSSKRTTAPQSPSSGHEVVIGFAILIVGVILVFGIPIVVGGL